MRGSPRISIVRRSKSCVIQPAILAKQARWSTECWRAGKNRRKPDVAIAPSDSHVGDLHVYDLPGSGPRCARWHKDLRDPPVFRVDQQDLVVLQLGEFETLSGWHLIRDMGRQPMQRHRWRNHRADGGVESRRGGVAPFALDALHDGLLLLRRQIKR